MGLFLSIFTLLFVSCRASTFTFVNKCDFSVWPGILASAGSPKLDSTGFELSKGGSRTFQAPTGWSGRFWGRTGCDFDGSAGSCSTGDCGSGEAECNGAGATPPATLAEFTLGSGSQDFYDVSLVDGYNLPILIEGTGRAGSCGATGCVTDLNRRCPEELRAEDGGACKSACEAFGKPEYCCSGAFNSPATCRPSMYSEIFKSACPKSYSYAYDDATSTFTCSGADYTITFCPKSSSSLKSASTDTSTPSTDTSPPTKTTGTTTSDDEPDQETEQGTPEQGTPSIQETAFATSWLADMATASESVSIDPPRSAIGIAVFLIVCFLHL